MTLRRMWIGGALCALAAVAGFGASSARPAPGAAFVIAQRAPLRMTLSEAGVLRARSSSTYRSPVEGRELEITWIAPEGAQVRAGDLLATLDTSALQFELDRARQALRQVEMQIAAARIDRDEAVLAMQSVTGGAGLVEVEEKRTELTLADARASRLRAEHAQLAPLLAKGYITRAEFDRSAADADEAGARAALAARAFQVLTERTQPANEQAARLQVDRQDAEMLHLQPQLDSARGYVTSLETAVNRCSIRAAQSGLVVYEDNFSTVPHRKIRAGDRVTPSQPLITLPDLGSMAVDASIREADLQLVRPGLSVTVHLDAFPGNALTGRLARVGAVARAPGADESQSRFDISVDLDATPLALRPAMNARIDIDVHRAPEIIVPISAVYTEHGQPFCRVERGGQIEVRPLTLGRVSDREVEIASGVVEGEQILLRAGGR